MKRKIKKIVIDYAKKNSMFKTILRKVVSIKNNILYLPRIFYKVNPNLIIFESYMGRSYDCSPKAIYEEMLKDTYFEKYKFIWVFKENYENNLAKNYIKDKRTKVVIYRSKEYYKAYAQAKYWVTNSRLPREIQKKDNQIYLQCWHGTPLKKLGHDIIEHTQNAMNTKKEINKRYDLESSKFDYFISPSKFATEKFKTAFNIQKEKIIIEKGYPRNDFLKNYKEEDIINFKKKFNIPLDKKVILYCPTFRDNQHESGVGYTYNINIDFEYLKEKLGNDYVILYRPHYLVANKIDIKKYEGFVLYDQAFIGNTNELYISSDILITDYSSALFDFANLNKPIIFYMYDLDFYKNDLRGFYLSLDELPGKIVTKEKEIVTIINNLEKYNNDYENIYKKLKEKFLYLDDGNASKRVINIVFKKGS